jgi:hypothetical protein
MLHQSSALSMQRSKSSKVKVSSHNNDIAQLKQWSYPTGEAEQLLKILEGVLRDIVEYREDCMAETISEISSYP